MIINCVNSLMNMFEAEEVHVYELRLLGAVCPGEGQLYRRN